MQCAVYKGQQKIDHYLYVEKEDDFVQGLRSIIDFLVKKAVEEMGSSQARAKVQAVIERMK